MKSKIFLLVLAAVAIPLVTRAAGPHHCCPNCGCSNLCKVCKLVPDVKKIPRTVHCMECEDFCVPGPSKLCGVKCVPDCNAHCGYRKESVWEPSCGKVYTRRKMVTKTIIEERPGFKCVVEIICNGCGCRCGEEACGDQPPATAPAPAPGRQALLEPSDKTSEQL